MRSTGYYTQLMALYESLGVKFRETDFSYSFSRLRGLVDVSKRKLVTTMIYNGASGKQGISMPSSWLPPSPVYKQRLSPTVALQILLARAQAYATFVFSALLIGALYLRLLYYSVPLHLSKSTTIPLASWLPTRPSRNTTLREWRDLTTPTGRFAVACKLDRRWRDFIAEVVIPLFSAVCTAGSEDIWNHPVEEFLGTLPPSVQSVGLPKSTDYIYLTLGAHHYVVANGVRDVVGRISANISEENVHLSSAIASLEYHPATTGAGASIDIHCATNQSYSGFSHVIFATQANQAIPLLKTYLSSLARPVESKGARRLEHHRSQVQAQLWCLSSFKYCRTVVVNHTDSSLLPPETRDRRDLNLVMASEDWPSESDICVDSTYAMATHVLPNASKVYQTTNPIMPIDKDKILSVSKLERAVVTAESKVALGALWRPREEERGREWSWGCTVQDSGMLGPLQGAGRLDDRDADCVPGIWLCGSYAYGGIPLLEGCVVSATNVVEQGIWVSEGL